MPESSTSEPPLAGLDALDQALVHALQIAPRAGWSVIAPVLGVDAATLRRRWQRLQDAGAAWVTCHPGPAVLDRRLAAALSVDGRASNTALAERLDTSPDTVHRRVTRLFAAGRIQARCEVARPLSDWPVAALLWVQAPSLGLPEAARAITGMREVRLCAAVTGRDNLLIVGWVRSVQDAQRFEARVAERAPRAVIADRAITLRPVKLSGQLLDHRGFRTGSVPVDPWV